MQLNQLQSNCFDGMCFAVPVCMQLSSHEIALLTLHASLAWMVRFVIAEASVVTH